MSGSYLLDTSVLVLSLRKNNSLDNKLAAFGELYVSSVTLGELYYGAERSFHRMENLVDIDRLSESLNVVNVDIETSKVYGIIRRGQENKGQILPENDLWIAATAIQYDLTLVARDHHFSWII